MLKQFLQISPNIIRCTYSMNDSIKNESLFIAQEMMSGQPAAACPVDIRDITFAPRPITKMVTDGKPVTTTLNTVDGQHTVTTNLREVFDHQGWRAEICIALDEKEHIYGLGQDEDGLLDKRGHIEYLYQHNMKSPIPMFVSSAGYAVLFNCACLMIFDDTQDACRITLECVDQLDFFVITGTMDEIIAGYRTLTGRASAMPDWVFGYWQSKEHYSTQDELVSIAERHRRDGVPLDVVVQDWKSWVGDLWGDKHLDHARYPDIKSAMARLHENNARSIVSVWPNMNPGGRDHAEFAEKKMLLGDYSTYDAFDPNARALYWKQAEEELYSGGFDGWWCDSTEPFASPDWGGEVKLPENERYELVGREHEKYIGPLNANAYALMHAKGFCENQTGRPVVNLTRSGWAGIQKYGVIQWAGDTSATWQTLSQDIVKGINMGLSGIPYWTVDAGAFFVGGLNSRRKWCGDPDAAPVWFWHGDYEDGVADKAYQELYTRWLQLACFLPIFRSHGTDTPREYWNFEEPFRSAIISAIKLRYRLMPYILNMAEKVVSEHFTIMRSLMFDFPGDPNSALIQDEFMFGKDILVCPVTSAQMYNPGNVPISGSDFMRKCYLPEGAGWYDFHTNAYYEGGQYVTIEAGLDRIPLFVRAGASIPVSEGRQYAAQDMPVGTLDYPVR